MKKKISLLLAILMLVTLIPTAFAESKTVEAVKNTKKVTLDGEEVKTSYHNSEHYMYTLDKNNTPIESDLPYISDFNSLLQNEYIRSYFHEKSRNVSKVETVNDVYSFLLNNPKYYYIDDKGFLCYCNLEKNDSNYFYEFKDTINNLILEKQIVLTKDLMLLDVSNNESPILTCAIQIDLLAEADKHVEEFKSYVLRVTHGLSFINHISWWIDKVKGGGIWDYKSYLGYNKYYDVLGLGRMSGESIGNFHYGYVGRFYFSEEQLLFGGDMYQALTSEDKLKMENYHDSPEDKYDIKRGCREYIERH